MFQNELQTSMLAWFEDPERGNKQQWPTGLAKQQIIRESIERTEFNISKMTEAFTRNSGSGTTRVAPAPAAPSAPVRIRNEADYNALPSGATYITPDGQTKIKQ
jgi:hypothetical protein